MILSLFLLVAAFGASSIAGAEDHVVTQRDKQFSVEKLRVSAGESVSFRNEDTAVHNIFSRSAGNEFEIKAQLPGQSTDVRFESPGTAKVRCAIHPQMQLEVEVVKPAK